MNQSRTTLAEMSKVLNLSVSTISKSLADSSEISLLTKKRVQEFANQCNYVPNHFAVSFRRGVSKTIGLIIPSILNPFYAKVLVGIENYLHEHGYKLITSISNESKSKELSSLTKMTGGYVDGLIICSSKETELLNEYNHINSIIEKGTPLVMFDRISEIIDCDKVIINDYKATYDITTSLINRKQCKNLLMVSLIDNLYHGKLRTHGFKDAISANKKNTKGKAVIADNADILRRKLEKILKKDTSVDGVFGVSEQAVLQTMQVIRTLNQNGFKRNPTIAGFCNQKQVELNSSLLIVDQNAEKMGVECAKLVLKRINKTIRKGFQTKTVAVSF